MTIHEPGEEWFDYSAQMLRPLLPSRAAAPFSRRRNLGTKEISDLSFELSDNGDRYLLSFTYGYAVPHNNSIPHQMFR